jgi:hypothetical protein
LFEDLTLSDVDYRTDTSSIVDTGNSHAVIGDAIQSNNELIFAPTLNRQQSSFLPKLQESFSFRSIPNQNDISLEEKRFLDLVKLEQSLESS